MNHEQLYHSCRSLVPEACHVHVDVCIATDSKGIGRATVDICATLDGREMWITDCKTCDEALTAFKSNVENLRFGKANVKVVASI